MRFPNNHRRTVSIVITYFVCDMVSSDQNIIYKNEKKREQCRQCSRRCASVLSHDRVEDSLFIWTRKYEQLQGLKAKGR